MTTYGYSASEYTRFRRYAWRYLLLFSLLYCSIYCTRLNLSNAGAVMMSAYDLIRAFPAEEKYALSDQLRRAVVSIPSNIAEGNGRAGNKDYAHFLAIARGSLFETITQLELARRMHYIDNYDSIRPLALEIGRMLTAMLQKYGSVPKENQPTTVDLIS